MTQSTSLNRQLIAIRKEQMVITPEPGSTIIENGTAIVAALQAEVMRHGFIFDQALFDSLCTLPQTEIERLYEDVLASLTELTGADKHWEPMYPNFPRQVMEAASVDLFVTAILHYWTLGEWKPTFLKARRLPKFEHVKFRPLSRGSEADFMAIFTKLLAANASISATDHKAIRGFVDHFGEAILEHVPENIPFKEQTATLAAALLTNDLSIPDGLLSTTTDALRLMVALSGGDVSLATPARFISLPRAKRRSLVREIERVVSVEDVARHSGIWKRAFHSLHIGEYAKAAPKTNEIANTLRNGTLRTFNSHVEAALRDRNASELMRLLGSRPGDLARRLDHILRALPENEALTIIDLFASVATRVSPRVLLQLRGHFQGRKSGVWTRVVFPKGAMSKAQTLRTPLPDLSPEMVDRLIHAIDDALRAHFSEGEALGKVWIDPWLKKCPVPLSMRSSADGLVEVGRGTRMPLSDKNTLRMFVWWVGRDIDLSCTFYDEDLVQLGHISYTNLRIPRINACHSGDITNAPNGAAEFIDIDIASALTAKARYVVMSVYDFTGQTFAKYGECFTGWMMREHPDANEIFDAKTVEQKIDLRSPSRKAIPVVFDLLEREAIWLDLAGFRASKRIPNNIETSRATLEDVLTESLSLENKPTLHDLFTLHAKARGQLVDTEEEAETIFAYDRGVTPFDIGTILSNYLGD